MILLRWRGLLNRVGEGDSFALEGLLDRVEEGDSFALEGFIE